MSFVSQKHCPSLGNKVLPWVTKLVWERDDKRRRTRSKYQAPFASLSIKSNQISIKNQAGSNKGSVFFLHSLSLQTPISTAFNQSSINHFSIQYSQEANGFRRKRCEKNEENLSLIPLQFLALPRKNFVTFSAISQLRDQSKNGHFREELSYLTEKGKSGLEVGGARD